MKYKAVIKKSGEWWIGWLIDLSGVNAQEKTKYDKERMEYALAYPNFEVKNSMISLTEAYSFVERELVHGLKPDQRQKIF